VLVTLWVPELEDERRQKEALVAQAAAEVKQAEAAVKAAGAGVETAQASVNQAKAGIGRADAEVEFGDSVHRRIKDLVSRGSVTDQLSDEALYKLRAAEAARAEAAADVEAANAQVSQAQANAAKAQADLVAAQARHSVAQANLAQANTMLAYLEIKAPFDGVVSRREVDTGHYVHPASGGGSKPLLVVTRIDKVRIFVDVPEMEAPLVDSNVDGGASGDAAVVRVQSLRNREFDATVTRKSWSLDTSNRSLRTEIDIDNADGRLRPGMYATATILLDQRENAWALPITAIIRDGQQPYCCCVVSGKIERRSIELGLRCGEEVEVVSGLDGSQTVVLARAESLQQGQQVEVIEPQQ
jgi:RND family efflux transporter MFP subunit